MNEPITCTLTTPVLGTFNRRGGDRHESGGDATEGALFYDTGTRPFGLDMVK